MAVPAPSDVLDGFRRASRSTRCLLRRVWLHAERARTSSGVWRGRGGTVETATSRVGSTLPAFPPPRAGRRHRRRRRLRKHNHTPHGCARCGLDVPPRSTGDQSVTASIRRRGGGARRPGLPGRRRSGRLPTPTRADAAAGPLRSARGSSRSRSPPSAPGRPRPRPRSSRRNDGCDPAEPDARRRSRPRWSLRIEGRADPTPRPTDRTKAEAQLKALATAGAAPPPPPRLPADLDRHRASGRIESRTALFGARRWRYRGGGHDGGVGRGASRSDGRIGRDRAPDAANEAPARRPSRHLFPAGFASSRIGRPPGRPTGRRGWHHSRRDPSSTGPRPPNGGSGSGRAWRATRPATP